MHYGTYKEYRSGKSSKQAQLSMEKAAPNVTNKNSNMTDPSVTAVNISLAFNFKLEDIISINQYEGKFIINFDGKKLNFSCLHELTKQLLKAKIEYAYMQKTDHVTLFKTSIKLSISSSSAQAFTALLYSTCQAKLDSFINRPKHTPVIAALD